MTAITRIDAFQPLPSEEPVSWRGRPTWRSAAIRIWKVRIIAIYFALLLADGARLAFAGTGPSSDVLAGDAKLLATAVIALGGLLLLAWLTKRTTLYTIDDHQVTMKYGIALQATLVIPFAAIEHVGIRIHPDHTGDVALRLKPGRQVIYPKLWPHARPWRLFRAEPMLRCIPQAGVAGALLCRAMASAAETRAALVQGVELQHADPGAERKFATI
jgi:membrane protein YdbS with pleckstrin-like domain